MKKIRNRREKCEKIVKYNNHHHLCRTKGMKRKNTKESTAATATTTKIAVAITANVWESREKQQPREDEQRIESLQMVNNETDGKLTRTKNIINTHGTRERAKNCVQFYFYYDFSFVFVFDQKKQQQRVRIFLFMQAHLLRIEIQHCFVSCIHASNGWWRRKPNHCLIAYQLQKCTS